MILGQDYGGEGARVTTLYVTSLIISGKGPTFLSFLNHSNYLMILSIHFELFELSYDSLDSFRIIRIIL
jgi:hypothetical protein